MSNLKILAMQAALDKMLSDGHFSICTIDKPIKSAGTIPDKESYQTLSLLHCVDYKDMSKELRSQIPSLIADCLREPALTMSTDALPIAARIDSSFGSGDVLEFKRLR